MASREKIDRAIRPEKYVIALVLAVFVFISGFLIGNYIAREKLNELSISQQSLMSQLTGLDLRKELSQNNLCDLSLGDITKEKVEMGRQMQALESRLGKEDSEVLMQKEIYELVEIKTILLLKQIKESCNDSSSIIMFFYTNRKNDPLGNLQQSEDQGYALEALYQRYPEKVNNFVFDINIKNPAIESLIQIYDIKTVPALVIDNNVYLGYQDLDSLEKILGFKK